jgi:hypothetical protein
LDDARSVAILSTDLLLAVTKARVSKLELTIAHQPKLNVIAVVYNSSERVFSVIKSAPELRVTAVSMGVINAPIPLTVYLPLALIRPQHGARGVKDHEDPW